MKLHKVHGPELTEWEMNEIRNMLEAGSRNLAGSQNRYSLIEVAHMPDGSRLFRVLVKPQWPKHNFTVELRELSEVDQPLDQLIAEMEELIQKIKKAMAVK